MGFHAQASFMLSLSSLIFGAFVFSRGRDRLPNITYSLMALSIALWCFGQFMGDIATERSAALFWTRVNLAGAILSLVFYVNFVEAYLNDVKNQRRVLLLVWLVGALFLILDATPLFVPDVRPALDFKFYPVAGATYPFFTIFFLFCAGWGISHLALRAFGEKGPIRMQIIYVLLSSIIGLVGAATLFLPVFGLKIYPFGFYFVFFYILLSMYAMVKHKLLDITVVIRKGLVYSILVLMLSVAYLGLIFLLGEVFKTFANLNSLLAMLFVFTAFAAVFNPLREKLQDLVDRAFFKSRYDLGRAIREISDAASFTLDLNALLNQVLNKVVHTLGAEGGAIFLKDRTGELKLMETVNLKAREGKMDVSVTSFPLSVKGNAIGTLDLGRKLSEDDYSDEDRELLSTLSNQLAIAIENASLHEEILAKERQLFHSDKLASLGTLSAGMAHEIKNPLTVIKGMVQVLPESMEDRQYLKGLSETLPRQIDRINRILEDMMVFAKPKRANKEEAEINSVIRHAAGFVSNECRKKGIDLRLDLGEDIPSINADKDLLTQALLNLMMNGIQSMEAGGELTVSSKRKTENGKQNILIEISDTGCGITHENLSKIFDPFFTTKGEGVGLGLAVTKRIIQEHGGSIEVESGEGEGTKFGVFLNAQGR